jgi:hypothetical protein
MILPSAVSSWPSVIPGKWGGLPAHALSLALFLARPVRRSDDAAAGSQRLINHNCFNSINDIFHSRIRAGVGLDRQAVEFVGVSLS